MTILTLPVSKYIIEIRESITFGEYQEIENFFQNRMKLEITDGKQNAIVDGSLVQQMSDKMIQTFLHSCKTPENDEKSTVGLLNTLDIVDGAFLSDAIADAYEAIKKKLGKAGKK